MGYGYGPQADRIQELWLGSQERMFADSVDLDGYGIWWSYISHFTGVPRLPDDRPVLDDPIPLSEEVLNLPPPVEISPPPELPDLLEWEEDLEKED